MPDIRSINARTGELRAVLGQETTAAQVDAICESAGTAFVELQRRGRPWRAALLRAMADGLEDKRDLIVETADAETGLGSGRLGGELTRTCFQLRMFADVVEEGSFLEATIDHAGDTAMGPQPDLRRMLVPTGPVAVFGASNFPLAFSVPGGDTASALAAGCPVVVKAHESHPETSTLCGKLLAEAASSVDAPDGTIALVYGRDGGGKLVQHPAITAVGFTGSVGGGRALSALIDQREMPIPFYGELGSINPLVVTMAAAAERPAEIGRGIVGSFTLGAGQFCTKPGLVLVPSNNDGDRIVAAAADATETQQAATMLNAGIAESFQHGLAALTSEPGVSVLATGDVDGADEGPPPAHLLEVQVTDLTDRMLEECFGPVTIVVRYESDESLAAALERLPSSLTATIHTGSADSAVTEPVRRALEARAGRVVFNGFPTGVSVSWAQHHGGGWPASNSLHTSVGATAVRRFLRPLAWQAAPQSALPVELRDTTVDIPRRVDGVLQPATS